MREWPWHVAITQLQGEGIITCEGNAIKTVIHINNTQSHVHCRRPWIEPGSPSTLVHCLRNGWFIGAHASNHVDSNIEYGAVWLFLLQVHSDFWLTLYVNMHCSIVWQYAYSAVNNWCVFTNIHTAQWPNTPLQGHNDMRCFLLYLKAPIQCQDNNH